MNEQAQQVLADMMQRALDGVDEAVEFSKAEIPAVIEQLLMWHMVESLIFFIVSLLIIALLVTFWVKMSPKIVNEFKKPSLQRSDVWEFFVPMFGGMASIGILAVAIPGILPDRDWETR